MHCSRKLLSTSRQLWRLLKSTVHRSRRASPTDHRSVSYQITKWTQNRSKGRSWLSSRRRKAVGRRAQVSERRWWTTTAWWTMTLFTTAQAQSRTRLQASKFRRQKSRHDSATQLRRKCSEEIFTMAMRHLKNLWLTQNHAPSSLYPCTKCVKLYWKCKMRIMRWQASVFNGRRSSTRGWMIWKEMLKAVATGRAFLRWPKIFSRYHARSSRRCKKTRKRSNHIFRTISWTKRRWKS